ncbi:MAG: hypothetical protein WB542_04680, partial [Polaromonas sp.]
MAHDLADKHRVNLEIGQAVINGARLASREGLEQFGFDRSRQQLRHHSIISIINDIKKYEAAMTLALHPSRTPRFANLLLGCLLAASTLSAAQAQEAAGVKALEDYLDFVDYGGATIFP